MIGNAAYYQEVSANHKTSLTVTGEPFQDISSDNIDSFGETSNSVNIGWSPLSKHTSTKKNSHRAVNVYALKGRAGWGKTALILDSKSTMQEKGLRTYKVDFVLGRALGKQELPHIRELYPRYETASILEEVTRDEFLHDEEHKRGKVLSSIKRDTSHIRENLSEYMFGLFRAVVLETSVDGNERVLIGDISNGFENSISIAIQQQVKIPNNIRTKFLEELFSDLVLLLARDVSIEGAFWELKWIGTELFVSLTQDPSEYVW